jgi:RhtB (resistance to homoserine/threonine) family protein
MGIHLVAFIGVAGLLIVTPGPDMALVTKNALLYGQRAALATSLGVNTGLLVWTVASALGVAALLRASALGFTALKLIGAAYLIWLGVQALRAASPRRRGLGLPTPATGNPVDARVGFRQGLLSNLANPKIAMFFTSLLPQFVASGRSVLAPFLLLGGVFVLMTVLWLCAYALVAVRASVLLRRPSVKATLDRLTGVVLIGLGIRLATERR